MRTGLPSALALLCIALFALLAFSGTIERVSVSSAGEQANSTSQGALQTLGVALWLVAARDWAQTYPGVMLSGLSAVASAQAEAKHPFKWKASADADAHQMQRILRPPAAGSE